MSVEELGALHNRYVELSGRFRAAWAFHQFIQSVQKVFMAASGSPFAAQFQEVYAKLKELSQNLNAAEANRVAQQLEAVGEELDQLIAYLRAEDNKVSPILLRQFFQRVRSYDEKILTQLLKFYLYTADEVWDPDRLDKTDYLLTRLGEDVAEPGQTVSLRDRRKLKEILFGLWRVLRRPDPREEQVEAHCKAIDELRITMASVDSLDEFNDRGLVRDYRELKKNLGTSFFFPPVSMTIMETNLTLRNQILQLYTQEERRIVSDYQRIFELEREVSLEGDLDEELAEFREEVEAFEKLLQDQELRLDDLAQIRSRVRSLLPRLTNASEQQKRPVTLPAAQEVVPPRRIAPATEAATAGIAPPPMPSRGGAADAGSFQEEFDRLIEALDGTPKSAGSQQVVLSPDIFPFRLEPREVRAFRSWRDGNQEDVDLELEGFLLEAAALRLRMNEEAEGIKELMDDTTISGEGPRFTQARRTLQAADAYLWQFNHMIDRVILTGDVEGAHNLQVLRMRLMRDYAGLWLVVYKPYLSSRSRSRERKTG